MDVSRKRPAHVVVLANIVAPYRVPTLRELAHGIDLTVLFSSAREPSREWSIDQRLPFAYEILGGSVMRVRNRSLYLNPRLLARLAAHRPSVMIVGGFSVPALYAWCYSIATGSGLVLMSEGTRQTERGLSRAGRLMRRLLIRRARACVGVSTQAAEWFEELGAPPNRCLVAPYALDVGDRPTHQFSTEGGRPARLLFVGQLIPRKGIRELVRAFARVSAAHDVKLTIVGSGPLEQELRSTIRHLGLDAAVELAGFVDQPNLPQVYAAHDLFVFPTLEDTFGVVLLEAMSAGVPVMASRLAGATRDFVTPGQNGWVLDSPSVPVLESALHHALEHRRDWAALGNAARRRMEEVTPARAASQLMRAVALAER